MMNFQFEAFGQKLSFEDVTVIDAYVRANKFFAQLLGNGVWMDEPAGSGVRGYRWIEGNFFD